MTHKVVLEERNRLHKHQGPIWHRLSIVYIVVDGIWYMIYSSIRILQTMVSGMGLRTAFRSL